MTMQHLEPSSERIPLRRFRLESASRGVEECDFAAGPASIRFPKNPFDLVHPELLVPPDGPIRGSGRGDAGMVLDRELVALSGVDARCRIIRARIVAKVIDRKGWRALGFVRLGDFARERLGVTARSLEEDARVIRATERLPLLRGELESGHMAWTRARLLTRVATPHNEATLLEESSKIPYRDLEEFLREYAERQQEADADPNDRRSEDAAKEPNHSAASTDLDPSVRWSMIVSRSGRRMWRAASEYASRSAGSALSAAQVLELVAAEASSAATSKPARETASPEDHEHRLRCAVREREQRGKRYLYGFLAETGVAEGFPWLEPNSFHPGPARALDALESDLDVADVRELERRLQRLRLVMQNTDAQVAALLRISIDRRLFLEAGFATVKLYVEVRLGMSARRMWSLVSIERQSWRSSKELRDAWRDGRLSTLRAAAIVPVLGEHNADAWIQRAQEVTLRRLQDEVAWALDHGQTRPVRDVMPPSETDVVRDDRAGDVGLCEVQNRSRGEEHRDWLWPVGPVRLDFSIPVSVAVLVESTLDALSMEGEPRWRTFERMIALALADWMATPRHRDPVFERDGWRCTVPACSSRRDLHDHHIKFQSLGGTDEQGNRTTVCAPHHLHGIHAGIIHAEGCAPDEIRWQMPLGRFVGDRYASD